MIFYHNKKILHIEEIKKLKEELEKESRNKENIQEMKLHVDSFMDYYNKDILGKKKGQSIISKEKR